MVSQNINYIFFKLFLNRLPSIFLSHLFLSFFYQSIQMVIIVVRVYLYPSNYSGKWSHVLRLVEIQIYYLIPLFWSIFRNTNLNTSFSQNSTQAFSFLKAYMSHLVDFCCSWRLENVVLISVVSFVTRSL